MALLSQPFLLSFGRLSSDINSPCISRFIRHFSNTCWSHLANVTSFSNLKIGDIATLAATYWARDIVLPSNEANDNYLLDLQWHPKLSNLPFTSYVLCQQTKVSLWAHIIVEPPSNRMDTHLFFEIQESPKTNWFHVYVTACFSWSSSLQRDVPKRVARCH